MSAARDLHSVNRWRFFIAPSVGPLRQPQLLYWRLYVALGILLVPNAQSRRRGGQTRANGSHVEPIDRGPASQRSMQCGLAL
jgi:hypothetical protein